MSLIEYVVIAALVTLIVVVLYFKNSFSYWKNKNVYTEKPYIPFGNAFSVLRLKYSHAEEFYQLYNKLKSKKLQYGGYYAFTKPLFVPADLDVIKNIMSNDFEHFMDHFVYVDEKQEPMAVNLITMKGAKWQKMRAKLTPAFTLVKMRSLFPSMLNCTDRLCKAFEQEMNDYGTTNVKELTERYTSDVVGSCIFGLDCDSLGYPQDDFRTVGKTFFDMTSTGNSLVHNLIFLIPSWLQFTKVPIYHDQVKGVFKNIITKNVEYREKHKIVRNDLLQLLIELKNKTSQEITFDELLSHSLLFFLAGAGTTSCAVTFCLYELAINTEIQENLRLEVKRAIANHGGITYDALNEMTYMDQCIAEALRKYPAIPVHSRECTKTYQIPSTDITLEKGTYIMIPVLGIHRDPEIYPNPDTYDPERFSKENRANRHSSAWIPFGLGPRTCIAEVFGLLQMKACIAALLQSYSFTLNSRTENPLTFDNRATIMLNPRGDVLLNIEKLKM